MKRFLTLQLGVSLFVLFFFIGTVFADTLFVDVNSTSGAGSGSADSPFKTISEAIEHSSAGDTVSVAEGKYVEQIEMKTGVSIVSVGGPQNTIIDGSGETFLALKSNHFKGHTVLSKEGGGSLSGFTITGAHDAKAGVFAWASKATFDNLVIKGNEDTGFTVAALYGFDGTATKAELTSELTLKNSIVTDNGGGGVFFGSLSGKSTVFQTDIKDNGGSYELGFYNAYEMEAPITPIIDCVTVEGVIATGANSDVLIGQTSEPIFLTAADANSLHAGNHGSDDESDNGGDRVNSDHKINQIKNGHGYGDNNHNHKHKHSGNSGNHHSEKNTGSFFSKAANAVKTTINDYRKLKEEKKLKSAHNNKRKKGSHKYSSKTEFRYQFFSYKKD